MIYVRNKAWKSGKTYLGKLKSWFWQKKLINWTDFSGIDDTVAVEQLPSDFCLLWALHQEILPFLHHHTLFFCFIPPHRPPSDPQSVCFIITISLFSTECCVPDTGTEKAPGKCVLNEWMSPNPFVHNFFQRHLTFREAQVPVGRSIQWGKLSPSVRPLHTVRCTLAPETK